MNATQKDNGEYEFVKEVQVEEGKHYQYKFRVGDGDTWVVDENAPTGMLPLYEMESRKIIF